jgi:NADH dehydrogenase/NADH:ubiquinone oxidoreductase subunit G
MITSLTMSIFVCIYLYTKHRQSVEQIKKMLIEFEKLSDIEDGTVVNQIKNNLSSNSSLFSFKLRKNSESEIYPIKLNSNNNSLVKRKESLLMSEKNAKLTRELNVVKQEADHLRKARENTDGQLAQLKLAEQELEKVRNALKQTEARLDLIKYQPPVNLINLLNKTFESEKELLDYKFKLIDKEKETCVDSLKKVCKRQSGLLGALKIAHSSTLEDIQHKLEILT